MGYKCAKYIDKYKRKDLARKSWEIEECNGRIKQLIEEKFQARKKHSHNTFNILIEIFIMFELKETEMGFLGLKVKQ